MADGASVQDRGTGSPLRVVFLTGADNRSTRMSVEAVCAIPGVVPIATLVDNAQTPFRRRLKNLRRSLRRNGWGYLPHRGLRALREYTDRLADRALLRPGEVEQLLRKAFPDHSHTLEDLGRRYGFPVRRVGSLNGEQAVTALKECDADLGIVLGTRILKATTFGVPRMGCINLHKGQVPQYRGMPAGFWELYDNAAKAGVTVHFVDSKLDTGNIVAAADVEIAPTETPDTLIEKLHRQGTLALVRAVEAIQNGVGQGTPQTSTDAKPRTVPTLREAADLHRRLPRWLEPNDLMGIVKNLFCLSLYFSGVYRLVRKLRRGSRATIILYHRVNDFSRDAITVDTRSFAGHLLAIAKHYQTMKSGDLADALCSGKEIPATTVLVHFDDAYRDVYTTGGPMLKVAGIPATAFVNPGFVDTDRQFAHDVEKYALRFENCRTSDLIQWVESGFEIGAHTVDHVDLGTCSLDEARVQIQESGAQLERMTGRRVRLFSFPFGGIRNIRPEVSQLIQEAGYDALFSAHGGFVGKRTDRWDIPRMGANSGHRPLWLLMEIEGIDLAGIARRLRGGNPSRQ